MANSKSEMSGKLKVYSRNKNRKFIILTRSKMF